MQAYGAPFKYQTFIRTRMDIYFIDSILFQFTFKTKNQKVD